MSFQPVGMEMDQSYWRGIQLFVTAAALPIEAKTTRVNDTHRLQEYRLTSLDSDSDLMMYVKSYEREREKERERKRERERNRRE